MKKPELKIYTLAEVKKWFSNHPDLKRYAGVEIRNDKLLTIAFVFDGCFGTFVNPRFKFASGEYQGPFSGASMNHALGRVLLELAKLLAPEKNREGADVLKLLADVPLRVAWGDIRCGQIIDGDGSLTFFGHLFQDRFIRLRELIDLDIPHQEGK